MALFGQLDQLPCAEERHRILSQLRDANLRVTGAWTTLLLPLRGVKHPWPASSTWHPAESARRTEFDEAVGA